MPLIYSTASPDILPSAFWYSFISFAILGPIINAPIRTNAITAGIRLISPSLQSKNASMPIRHTGVATDTTLSGKLGAR